MSEPVRSSSVQVVPAESGTRVRKLAAHEVAHAQFSGSPIVCAFSADSCEGAMNVLSVRSLDSDLGGWFNSLRSTFGKSTIAQLKIKLVLPSAVQTKCLAIFRTQGVDPAAVEAVSEDETLDCFFYPLTGRLRVAKSKSVVESKSELDVHSAPTPTLSSNSAVLLKSAVEKKAGTASVSRVKRKLRVLVVDDSKTIRDILKRIIHASPDLEVVGEADRPSQVDRLILDLKPDVMTLDINMPEMSGIELLRQVLAKTFIPVVMFSSLGMDEGHEVLDALEIGAVDYIQKPASHEMALAAPMIQEKIFAAAHVRQSPKRTKSHFSAAHGHASGSALTQTSAAASQLAKIPLIAIGASTGGTEAIKSFLSDLPSDIPPIVIVQHIPPYFSTAFANRLNQICPFEVREAQNGDEVRRGRVLIAPGGQHMKIERDGAKVIVRVFDGEPVNRFKPSVDVLFGSVASVAKEIRLRSVGILLTGMGSDGAKGLLAMRESGAVTLAQNEESCVVFGMPRAAIELGAACHVCSLEDMANQLSHIKI